eukprot:2328604-Pyramimonas_sp.AAC.1
MMVAPFGQSLNLAMKVSPSQKAPWGTIFGFGRPILGQGRLQDHHSFTLFRDECPQYSQGTTYRTVPIEKTEVTNAQETPSSTSQEATTEYLFFNKCESFRFQLTGEVSSFAYFRVANVNNKKVSNEQSTLDPQHGGTFFLQEIPQRGH